MRKYIDIITENENKDHKRAISCIDQILKSNDVNEKNSELLRNDIELLVMDALHYGKFSPSDESKLKRIRHSFNS